MEWDTETKEINWSTEVKATAEDQEMSITEIAKQCNVSQQYMQMVATGKKVPSSLVKAKIFKIIGADFNDKKILVELLEKDTKEFVIQQINQSANGIIKQLRVAKESENWPEVIKLLAQHRNWTTDELSKDLGIPDEDMRKILEGAEIPKWVDKFKIKDRVNYDLANYSIIEKLPESIGNKLRALNKWNMNRLAAANRKKIAKDGN